MLIKNKHEQILKNILRDIYTTTDLEAKLAFKGGTCLYFFYGLDRFSVDLDFNLIAPSFDADLINKIAEKYLNISERTDKHYTWFWLGSYEKGKPQIKIEISKREFPDTYTTHDFYGITIPTLTPDSMFAHKLTAITDRKKPQNRDLYDAHFMFEKDFPINEAIIKMRTGMNLIEYFGFLSKFIEKKVVARNILHGLGELLDSKQKEKVKERLINDLLFDLKSRIS